MTLKKFGLYLFIFLLTESLINEKAAVICGASQVNYIYAIGLIFTALGYLSFSFSKITHSKKIIVFNVSIIEISLFLLVLVKSALLLIVCGYICLLSLGYFGAYIHYLNSFNLHRKNYALNLGLCSTFAIVAQYIVQNIDISFTTSIVILLVAASLLLFTVIMSDEITEDISSEKDFLSQGISINVRTIVYVSAVAIMSVILGFQDSIIVAKNATGELQLFSYVRLFYAVGLLLAGIIANIKNRVYLPLASGCAMTLSVLSISFFGNSNSLYNISMAIMYFYCGFYVMFMTIMFMELGIRKSEPKLYAGFGRIVRSLVTCITVLFTTIFSNIGTPVYTILSCILSIALLILMALSGILIPERTIIKEIPVSFTEESLSEKLEKFFEEFSLTPKEQEAFIKLTTTEMGVQEIADEMAISRRVLQRHIASIYEKTGTKTRVGLLMLFR